MLKGQYLVLGIPHQSVDEAQTYIEGLDEPSIASAADGREPALEPPKGIGQPMFVLAWFLLVRLSDRFRGPFCLRDSYFSAGSHDYAAISGGFDGFIPKRTQGF